MGDDLAGCLPTNLSQASYVGIIRIRFTGRWSHHPLSLCTSSPKGIIGLLWSKGKGSRENTVNFSCEIPGQEETILVKTAVEVLSGYGLPQERVAHWQRVFRAILHGFIAQEDLGYFYYYDTTDVGESRDIAIQCFLDGLHAEVDAGEKNRAGERNHDEE